MSPENFYKVIIIGAGPAGISCAIQLKRSGIMPVIFEVESPGGLLNQANLVENYPGFPGGIAGTELAELMVNQLNSENIIVIRRNVSKMSYDSGLFIIETSDKTYFCEIAVVASGTKPVTLDGIDISPMAEKMIFYGMIVCSEVSLKKIVIIGAGDLAFDYALNLSKSSTVAILNRSDKPKCLPLLFERFTKANNCKYYNNISIESVSENNGLLQILCKNNGNVCYFDADYIIAAIGRKPNISFISDELLVRLNEFNKNKKLFIIGDAANEHYRQAAIAAGDGVRIAMIINDCIN